MEPQKVPQEEGEELELASLLLKVCRGRKLVGSERRRLDQLKRSLTTLNLASTTTGYRLTADGARNLAPELEQMTTLVTLDLGQNAIGPGIRKLSGKLGKLVSLTTLNLEYNKIDMNDANDLGPHIQKLVKLTSLDLGHNSLSAHSARALATALQELPSLTFLDLGWNRIQAAGVKALAPVLSKLTNLVSLNLGFNNLREAGATHLAQILEGLAGGALSSLLLGHNDFGERGVKVLAPKLGRLSRLTYLDIGGNFRDMSREAFASDLAPALGKLVSLTSLNIENNGIRDDGIECLASTLGDLSGLTALNLSSNQIQNLPLKLLRTSALRDLPCGGNRLQSPPPSTARDGLQAMREWLRAVEASGLVKKALAKLVFIGLPDAGKTSLYKALSKHMVLLGEKSTVGGNLGFVEWQVAGGQETVTFRAFDWAGQKEYGAMQRLFFTTEHCLYLLVVDVSKAPDEDLDEINARVDLVQAVAPGATFILVGTKSDLVDDPSTALRRLELVRSKVQEAVDTEVSRVAQAFDVDNLDRYLGQPAPLIMNDLFVVSSERSRGLSALEGYIASVVTSDPVKFKVGLPKSWVALMDSIREAQRQPANADSSSTALAKKVMSREDFEAQFRSKTDPASKEALRYLTEVGYVLHFEKLEGLRGKVFLDPGWLVGECLGKLFDHTLAKQYEAEPNAKVRDAAIQLCEKGVLETFFIPTLLGEVGDEAAVLALIDQFKLGYSIGAPKDGKTGLPSRTYLPAKWPEMAPPSLEKTKWETVGGEQVRGWYQRLRRLVRGGQNEVRGWRLRRLGDMPVGFFETVLVQSGICTRAPPEDGHWWQGGVLTELDGVSILIRRCNPGDPTRFSEFDILGSKPAQKGGGDAGREIWEVIGKVVLEAIKVHRDLFGGDQLIHYSAACPQHPGCFVPLPYSMLIEMLKPGAIGAVRGGFDGCPVGDHMEVPWKTLAPDPGPLSNTTTVEYLEGIAAAVDDMARAQRAFPKLLDNATQFLAKLVEEVADTVVEVSTARTPRAFAISPERTSIDPLGDTSKVLETVAAKAQEIEAAVKEPVQAAQKSLLVGYHFLSRGLFQHTAVLYLLCESCFKVPDGHEGYPIHRNTQWGDRVASALTVLVALGKVANVVGNVLGAGGVVTPFVKVAELLKKPLEAQDSVPNVVRDITAQMQHFSEKGLDSVELTRFLEEHDKGGEWKKFLVLERNREREPGRPAVVWMCATCAPPVAPPSPPPVAPPSPPPVAPPALPLPLPLPGATGDAHGATGPPGGHPDDKDPDKITSPGGRRCWARLTRCCGAPSSP